MSPVTSNAAGSSAVSEPARSHRDGSARRRQSAWLLLRQRNFRIYFIGSLVSNLGTWLQGTAQILIAYQLSHSVFIVGLITSAQFAGMVLVSPWAAVLADRIGTKAFLIGTQGASACIALCMAWLYHNRDLSVHTLAWSALGLGFTYALALPVQTALVPVLVGPDDVTNAVKMNSVSYNAGRALAPALSVLVIGFFGAYPIFVLNAASFTVFALCLARILRHSSHISNVIQLQNNNERGASHSRRAKVSDGFRTARQHPRFLLLLAIVAAVTLADDPIQVMSPALAHTKLQISGHWTGYFIAALGWGSVLASLPPTSGKYDGARRASQHAAYGLVILSISVFVFTMGISAQASLLAAFTAGAAGLYTGAAAQTALLLHQKEKAVVTVASVAALWAIAWAGTKPFASLLDGWLATHIGLTHTALILVLPALLIAFGELLFPRSLKHEIDVWSKKRLLPHASHPFSPERQAPGVFTTPATSPD
jgi:predicted MFS family arabinose efflux permease